MPDEDDQGPSDDDLRRFSGDTTRCPRCGADVWDDAPACPACGEGIGDGGPRGPRPRTWIAWATLLALAAMAVLALRWL